MNSILKLLPVAIVMSACGVGPELHEFKPANSPAGIKATVKLQRFVMDGYRLRGELLAADAKRFMLLLGESLPTEHGPVRLVELPRSIVRQVKLEQVGTYLVRDDDNVREDERMQRFRNLSRYPQGLSDAVRDELLRELGQASVYVPQDNH